MIWLYGMLVLTSAATVYLLSTRRSRFLFVAVLALALAIVALAGGFSIGYLIAPAALLLQTVALAAHIRASETTQR